MQEHCFLPTSGTAVAQAVASGRNGSRDQSNLPQAGLPKRGPEALLSKLWVSSASPRAMQRGTVGSEIIREGPQTRAWLPLLYTALCIRTVLRVIAQGSTDIATRLTALRGVPALLQDTSGARAQENACMYACSIQVHVHTHMWKSALVFVSGCNPWGKLARKSGLVAVAWGFSTCFET